MITNFVVEHLGASQVNHELINFVNLYTETGHPSIVFFDKMQAHPQQLLFSTMHISEAYNSGGVYITTSIAMAKKIMAFPCSKTLIYYAWDFEWMRQQQPYKYWADIMCNPDIIKVARTRHYAKVMSQCFNTEIQHSCNDFDYDVFSFILRTHKDG